MAVGTFGMCLAGIALNFPVASLPPLAVLLLTANVIAYATAPQVWKDWLRWSIFFLTAVIVQIWGVRLGVTLAAGESAAALGRTWFIPAAGAFAFLFFAASLKNMLRAEEGSRRFFDYVAPTASAFIFFTAARHVALPLWESGLAIGAAGLVGATAHLVAASWMVKGRKLTALEFNSFVTAAIVLLVLSLSAATGAFVIALPLLSAAAFHRRLSPRDPAETRCVRGSLRQFESSSRLPRVRQAGAAASRPDRYRTRRPRRSPRSTHAVPLRPVR